MIGSAPDWVNAVMGERDPVDAWKKILSSLREVALVSQKSGALDRATVIPDRVIANCAWNLWDDFQLTAPTAVDALKQFWIQKTASGTAVLLLDALSLREMPIILGAALERGLSPTRADALGSQIPSDTNRFAAALGISGRSKLFNNQPPASFIFGGPDVHTDVLDAPFADCTDMVPSKPRLFLWHKWPDEPLIHLLATQDDGPDIVASRIKQQLISPEFWQFIDRIRQGRRLVITSDHGYAVSRFFSDEIRDPDTIHLMRSVFGARRYAAEAVTTPWPRRHLPPLVSRHDGQLVVVGQRKWAVQGGFPHLCHGGLSLLEAVVPFIEFPAK